jgi:hypothetical protein
MGTEYRLDIPPRERPLCAASLKCAGMKASIPDGALIDTGAMTCHMTFSLFKDLGLTTALYNNNPALAALLHPLDPKDLQFGKLPFQPLPTGSIVGSGEQVMAYQFRLDTLTLGDEITLPGVTVRLIHSELLEFIVGMNVLRYLDFTHSPGPNSSRLTMSLSDHGRAIYLANQRAGLQNAMRSTFHYLDGGELSS